MASLPRPNSSRDDIIEGAPTDEIQRTLVPGGPGRPPPRLEHYVKNYKILLQQRWYLDNTEMQNLLIQIVNAGLGYVIPIPLSGTRLRENSFMKLLIDLYKMAFEEGRVPTPEFQPSSLRNTLSLPSRISQFSTPITPSPTRVRPHTQLSRIRTPSPTRSLSPPFRRTPSLPSPQPPPPSPPICIVCSYNQIDTLLQCGHPFCNVCVTIMRTNGQTCPRCRHPISEYNHKIYFNKYLKYKQKYIKLKK